MAVLWKCGKNCVITVIITITITSTIIITITITITNTINITITSIILSFLLLIVVAVIIINIIIINIIFINIIFIIIVIYIIQQCKCLLAKVLSVAVQLCLYLYIEPPISILQRFLAILPILADKFSELNFGRSDQDSFIDQLFVQ